MLSVCCGIYTKWYCCHVCVTGLFALPNPSGTQKHTQHLLFTDYCSQETGPRFNIKTVCPSYGIPMLKIRRSRDRLTFSMGIPILVIWHLYIQMPPLVLVNHMALKCWLEHEHFTFDLLYIPQHRNLCEGGKYFDIYNKPNKLSYCLPWHTDPREEG